MKQHLYPLVILLLTGISTYSQDTLPSGISRDSSIRTTLVRGYKYPQLVYSANGEVLNRREIISRLALYPEPTDELQKYRDAQGGMIAWGGVMLVSVFGAAAEKAHNNSGAAVTFAGVFLSAMIGEFITGAQAQRHLKQAIRIYNKRFVP